MGASDNDGRPDSSSTGSSTTCLQYRTEIENLELAAGALPNASPQEYSIRIVDSSFPNVYQTIVDEALAERLEGDPLRDLRPGFTRVYMDFFSDCKDMWTPLAEIVFPQLAHVGSSTSSKCIEVHDTSILDRLQEWMQRQVETLFPALLELAATLREQGSLEGAKYVGEYSLRRCREVYGDDHGTTNAAKHDLAHTLFKQGKARDAARMFAEVLDRYRQGVGNKINLPTAKASLAAAYSELGKLDEAAEMQNDVLDTTLGNLGEHHPDTITAMNNLSITLQRQGRFEDALSLQTAMLNTLVKLGPDNLTTASTMRRMACTLGLMGQTKQAERFCRLALEMMQRFLPSRHPDLIGAMNDLANACQGLGWTEEAEAMLRRTLERSEQTLGKKHPDTVMARNDLGCTLVRGGKLEDATKLLKTSLEQNEEIWGRKHFNTVRTRNNLAEARSRQGKNAEAVHLQKEALDDCRAILGDAHHFTDLMKKNVTYREAAGLDVEKKDEGK